MGKVIELNFSYEELKQLENARTYSEFPSWTKDFLRNKGRDWDISDNAAVVKSVKGLTWLILDRGNSFLQVYYLEIADLKQNKVIAHTYYITPTHSDNIYDYHIFQVGISGSRDTKLFINGHERESLTDQRQLQKWDYFFQASLENLGIKHDRLAAVFDEWREHYQPQLTNQGVKAGLIAVGAIGAFVFLWPILAALLTGLAIYRFRAWFSGLFRTLKTTQTLSQCAKQLQEEKEYLQSQVYQAPVSGNQINEWLNEEIQELDRKALAELLLPTNQVIRREMGQGMGNVDMNKDTLGLKIQEWGITQPLSTDGKSALERRHGHHLRALRYNSGKPLVGVYYIYFIYLTPDKMGISGFFYDFILAKRFGSFGKQWNYSDIESIGTEVKEIKVLSDLEELETKQIVLHFNSGATIRIALTDKVAIENLREQIENKRELDFDNQIPNNLPTELDLPNNFDLDQIEELSEDGLPATRSNFVLTNVITYWNQKKNLNLPPGPGRGYLS